MSSILKIRIRRKMNDNKETKCMVLQSKIGEKRMAEKGKIGFILNFQYLYYMGISRFLYLMPIYPIPCP